MDDSASPSLPEVLARTERVRFDPRCQLVPVSVWIEHDIHDVMSNPHTLPVQLTFTAASAH